MKDIMRTLLTAVSALAMIALSAGTGFSATPGWESDLGNGSGISVNAGAGGGTEDPLNSVGLPYLGMDYGVPQGYQAAGGGVVEASEGVGLPYFGQDFTGRYGAGYGYGTGYGAGAGGSTGEVPDSVGLPYQGQGYER
jgi:hypothetical protein